MKTKKQVIKENKDYKALINAVISNIGLGAVEDVNRHGIDGGFSGFIYYADTHKFAMRYRRKIVELLEEDAKQLGKDVVEVVSNFGVFRRSPMDSDDRKDLYKYLGGGRPEQGALTNVMAWYAAETVCRWFEE